LPAATIYVRRGIRLQLYVQPKGQKSMANLRKFITFGFALVVIVLASDTKGYSQSCAGSCDDQYYSNLGQCYLIRDNKTFQMCRNLSIDLHNDCLGSCALLLEGKASPPACGRSRATSDWFAKSFDAGLKIWGRAPALHVSEFKSAGENLNGWDIPFRQRLAEVMRIQNRILASRLKLI
jgi:hypothetical protein